MSERSSFPSSFSRLKSDFFRDSDIDDDSFFSDPIFSRSRLRNRFGDSVFDSFPRRSSMRTFPSAFDSSREPFGSRWHHPSWVDDELRRSRGSSPSDFRHSPTPPSNHSGSASPGTNQQQQSFFSHRKQDGSARGFRESSSQTSRASTPGSERSDGSRWSKGNADMDEDSTTPEPGVERHPSVNSKVNAKASYSAQRQPKVHHIPIRVEPREESGSSKPTSPPVNSSASSSGFQNAAKSPPHGGEQSRPMPRASPFASSAMPREEYTTPPVNGSASSSGFQNAAKSPPHGGEQSRPMPRASPFASSAMPREASTTSPTDNAKSWSSGENIIPVKVESNVGSGNQRASQQPQESKASDIPMQTSASPPPPPVPPQARKLKPTPMEVIELTMDGVTELRPMIENFDGRRGDKDYLYLDEMLTRLLIRLDYIEPEGNSELRQARKAAILKINKLIRFMEDKVASHEEKPPATDGEPQGNAAESQSAEQTDDRDVQTMEVCAPAEDAGPTAAAEGDPKRDDAATSQTENGLSTDGETMMVEDGENKSSEDSGIASSEETNLQSDDTEKATDGGAKSSAVASKDEPKKFKTVATVQLSDCDATVPSTPVIDVVSETSEK